MGIDLNTIEEEEDDAAAHQTARHQHHPTAGGSSTSVCLELWHACAGPLISLPRKGSAVVYLPQGHVEQMGDGGGGGLLRYDVPPHVFCRVVDVKLHAEAVTDEVYAQLSLVAESEELEQQLREGKIEGDGEMGEVDGASKSSTPHMFCKTLTASDTSTHGGFSVPRRAAEDCFPPLDYKQQRPSQELIAKDLHGMEWKFRHIYRGQPRRHLLTTGWSAFVNKKKLVSGDAVLFLRGDDGELRLGIRRAAQLKSSNPYSVLCSQGLNIDTFAAVANSLSTKSTFHISYNPRGSSSDFIIPYWKFTKSFNYPFSIGMRFKMRFESEDAGERRFTGLITGIGDIDPVRWPGSKWRCLLVRWDDDVDATRLNRVSPWEIEPTGSVSGSNGLSPPGSKRTKVCLPSVNQDFPVPNGSGYPDFGESARFHKVLQGQEIMGFRTPFDGTDVSTQVPEIRNHQFSERRGCLTDANSCMIAGAGNSVSIPIGNSDVSYKGIGFGESFRFHKVLQGQEIFPVKPPYRGSIVDPRTEYGGFGIFEGVHMSSTGSRWPAPIQGSGTVVQPSIPSSQVSSPSSVLMFQQASSQFPFRNSVYGTNDRDKGEFGSYCGLFDCSEVSSRKQATLPYQSHHMGNDFMKEHYEMGKLHAPVLLTKSDCKNDEDIFPSGGANSCRLFGFPLTERIHAANEVDGSPSASPSLTETNMETSFSPSKPQKPTKSVGRSCTKVHKQGSVVGRAIDLSKLGGYDDLICELERLFDMEGLLNDPQKGWQVVYTDAEDDMMLVGDDPWQEFCSIASKILIYTHDEVEMMACRGDGYDARSCSEEAPSAIHIAKFPLGCSNFSPTSI